MAARLKVFSWSDGFHAFTVAASSRAKALEAWGIEGDIFKTGLAKEDADSPDAEAARAKPGEVIERGLSVDVGKAAPKSKPKLSPAKDKARAQLKALEAELETLDAAQAEAQADLDKRRAELDREARALEADQAKARKALTARIKAARDKL
jgi:hypothetical protein